MEPPPPQPMSFGTPQCPCVPFNQERGFGAACWAQGLPMKFFSSHQKLRASLSKDHDGYRLVIQLFWMIWVLDKTIKLFNNSATLSYAKNYVHFPNTDQEWAEYIYLADHESLKSKWPISETTSFHVIPRPMLYMGNKR